MSTTYRASATPGTNDDTRITRLSLPSFAPARDSQDRSDSQAGSSTSGSRWSDGDRQSRNLSNFRNNISTVRSDNAKSHPSSVGRRQQNRSSGGFLLEPTTHSARLSRTLLSRAQQDPKGKRKSDISELFVSKRRNRQSVLEKDDSHKGSPLSVEVKQDQDGLGNGNSSAVGGLQNGGRSVDGYSDTPASQRSAQSAGLDVDAAQIVDMALKLSEGRRRQASGMRLASGNASGKRVISTTSSHQFGTPTKILGNRGNDSKLMPSSPLPSTSVPNDTIEGNGDMMQVDGPPSSLGQDQYAFDVTGAIEVSRATAGRVDKAKTYLELAYEHRRLLSHLPPIQRPQSHVKHSGTAPDSKIYNPLQYARNRKLRIREKTAIDAEHEGWHDVEKVRAWVDAVMNSHTGTFHDPLECVRLPPLSLRDNPDDEPRSPGSQASPRSPRTKPTRPRRPKSDWVTHPGDLIADAFWLEQGLNKTKIQDRDNNAVYPADTSFKFSGWRNRTPGKIPERLQQPSPPEEDYKQKRVPLLSSAPELPTFKSAHSKDKDVSHSRKKSKLKDSLAKHRGGSGKRKMAVFDSSSDSASDSDASSRRSESQGLPRGRKHTTQKFNLPDGDPFGQPISIVEHEAKVNGVITSNKTGTFSGDSKRSSIDHSRLANYSKHDSGTKSVSRDRGRSRGPTKRQHFFHHSQGSRDHGKDDRTSMEDDSTTHNSPAQYGFPSIAINLDPPVSRSPSPTKKSTSGLFSSLKNKSKSLDQERVETNDFAKRNSTSHSRGTSRDVGPRHDSSNETSRGTSPFTRGTSPFTKLKREPTAQDDFALNTIEHRDSAVSRTSTRPLSFQAQDQPSRIRGIFKGGRIAELVGNEVSRVGDFIWKRDIPPSYRHQVSGSEGSFRTYDPSDTDEEPQNAFLRHKRSREPRHSTSTLGSSGGQGSPDTQKSSEKPALHNPNLPSFTSPFQRDREKQDKKPDLLAPDAPLGADDHISRQAAQHRNRSKSPRLDRLAPPKLDTSAPRSVGVVERKNSYGFGDAMTRSQSASRAFNNAINAQKGGIHSARSSYAGFGSDPRKSRDSTLHKSRPEGVCKRDLLRLQALLLISAVKAKNINKNSMQIPSKPSKLLLNTTKSNESRRNASRTRRRDEHVIAAQNLILQLDEHTDNTNNRLQAFSSNIIARLHQEIQAIEDQIENRITPRVRTAADSAGELSVMLTTKSTQAVKSMHDVVSEAFRLRRRGPSRWLRLFGYTLMEWAVVGLLWFIWAIVTFVRIFIGIFRITTKTVRWLLWID